MRPLPIRARLTAWYLAVILVTFVLSFLGMYFGMRSTVEHMVDRQLTQRVDDMRLFLWRHRLHSRAEMPEQFFKSSGVQPGEELYQVMDSSAVWLYQAPSMRQLDIPGEPPDPNRAPRYTTISRRYVNIRVLSSTIDVSGQYYLVQVATVLTPLYDVLAGFRVIGLCILPVVLLTAGVGGYLLSGRAMRPVQDIASAARGISEHNLSERLVVPVAKDELRQLSETVNDMLRRLDAAFTRITQFTADASHELRTPIAVIRTTSEVILERPRSVEEYEEMVGQILAEAEFTTELIENLLTLARTDANPAQLQLSPVDARRIVEEMTPGSQALASRHGLAWLSSVEPEQILIMVEKQSIRRLLAILVDNAIKYTPQGGTIHLTLRSTATQAVFEIIDSGVGIMPKDLPHIFERFYRGANARYINSDGSGLGLAIAQWIARAHHGTLEVLSVPGEGTTFQLNLPLQLHASNCQRAAF